MAQFTRTNGDFQPVLNLDYASYTNTGVNTNTSGSVVQPQGPKLDFFNFVVANVQANGTVTQTVIRTVEQLATVMIYQVNAGGGGNTQQDNISLAVYPTGARSNVASTNGGTSPANLTSALNTATGYANVSGTQVATFNTLVDYE